MPIIDWIVDKLSGHGANVLIGLVIGAVVTWLIARWRRIQERRKILQGDARDTVVIEHHIIETDSGRPARLRIRCLGQAELRNVVPNGHLAGELRHRAFQVTPLDTLISMEGAEGSFLLETLTGFVCDRTGSPPFDHDLFVLAPCCETKELAHHQPIVLILIARRDLALLEEWTVCRQVEVEHGSDGARILTLMLMAQRFREEQEEIAERRREGKRTLHIETMYVLDLALDRRTMPVPTRRVPWGRFEAVLRQLGLEPG
jgi:hypothetical protein